MAEMYGNKYNYYVQKLQKLARGKREPFTTDYEPLSTKAAYLIGLDVERPEWPEKQKYCLPNFHGKFRITSPTPA